MLKSLVVALVLSVTSIALADTPDKDLHIKCLYPTVKLEQPASNGGFGSGFIVRSQKVGDNHYINALVTANHVLGRDFPLVHVPTYKNWSTLTGYTTYPGMIYDRNAELDLAIIIFESDRVMYRAEMDFDTSFFIGTPVLKFGFGVNRDCRLDYGQVTSVSMVEGGDITKGTIRVNADTIQGDSGGPLFLHSNKKVIGMTKALGAINNIPLTSHGFMNPISNFKKWNDDNKGKFNFIVNNRIKIPVTHADIEKAIAEDKAKPPLIEFNFHNLFPRLEPNPDLGPPSDTP